MDSARPKMPPYRQPRWASPRSEHASASHPYAGDKAPPAGPTAHRPPQRRAHARRDHAPGQPRRPGRTHQALRLPRPLRAAAGWPRHAHASAFGHRHRHRAARRRHGLPRDHRQRRRAAGGRRRMDACRRRRLAWRRQRRHGDGARLPAVAGPAAGRRERPRAQPVPGAGANRAQRPGTRDHRPVRRRRQCDPYPRVDQLPACAAA